MTLADTIAQQLGRAGCTNPQRIARQIITEVRDHDAALLDQIRVRDLPLPDCPDGCVVGNEWRRQALASKEVGRA